MAAAAALCRYVNCQGGCSHGFCCFGFNSCLGLVADMEIRRVGTDAQLGFETVIPRLEEVGYDPLRWALWSCFVRRLADSLAG